MTAPAASQSIPALSWPDQSDESEVCEGAAARLCIEWPALLNAVVQESYVYDGKLLGPPPGPRKQLLPIMRAQSSCITIGETHSMLSMAWRVLKLRIWQRVVWETFPPLIARHPNPFQ